jgi:hypothetical protein
MQGYFIQVAQSPETAWVVFVKWAAQILSGLFLLLSFLVTFRHNVRVRASDLLLKLEEHFNTLGSKLAFLEYRQTCYQPIKDIFVRFVDCPDSLSESERKTLSDIDDCIRFLYICTLQSGDKINLTGSWWNTFFNQSRLPHAYHYYLNKLNDEEGRPELVRYVGLSF